MTGFGRAKQTVSDYNVTVEVKSVNHRYFEFSSRVPRAYAFLEEQMKALCGKYISRGKVELSVQIEDGAADALTLAVNEQYADAFVQAVHDLATRYGVPDDLSAGVIARNPEIFSVKRREADDAVLSEAVGTVAKEALEQFVAMRAVEGERLKKDLLDRGETILGYVAFVEERSPQTVTEYREKLEQKMRDLLGDTQVDEQRLLTETAIFADKIAVAEETVRLRSHIKQLGSMLETGGAVGRKLDFLVQEMNREANTIGSKAQDLEITRTVVEIKAEIEKIREQVQNIE